MNNEHKVSSPISDEKIFKKIERLKEIHNHETETIKRWQSYKDLTNNIITSGFIVVPFTVLYYSEFFKNFIDDFKYWLTPFSLGIYYINFEKSHKKTLLLLANIQADMAPLAGLLEGFSKLAHMLALENNEEGKSEKSMVLALVSSLGEENKYLFNFVVEVLSAGAKKHSNNPAMMKQELGGDVRVRLLIIYSFLDIIERSDEEFSVIIDSKPALSIAAMDFWEKSIHSYSALTSKCADELNDNLSYLEWPKEKLQSTFGHRLSVKNLVLLLLTQASPKDSGTRS